MPTALTTMVPTGLSDKLSEALTPNKKPLDLQLFTSIHEIPSNPTDSWITRLSQAANKGKI